MIKLYFVHILHMELCVVQYLFKTSNLVLYVSNINCLFDMLAKNSSCNRKDDVLPRVFNKTHPLKKCVNVFEEYVMHV
jgi:hypothetical protein